MQQFATNTVSLQIGVNQKDAEDLFVYLDANRSGSITLNELKLVLEDPNAEQPHTTAANVEISKQLEDDIRSLFDSVDTNKNGTIERHELFESMKKVGMMPNDQELDA